MIRSLTGKSSTYDSVFMDLDGTISDSGDGIIAAVRYMFENIGLKETDDKKIRAFLGPPVVYHLIENYDFSREEALKAYAHFKEYYIEKGIFQNKLYDGIVDVIENIRKCGEKVYIATSKPDYQALLVLNRFGIHDLFSGVFAAKHDVSIYGKDEVLEYAVEQLGSVNNAVMIGDRYYDIHGGKHVGFDTIGVLYGYGDEKELAGSGPDFLVDSTQDLSDLLIGDLQ